MKTSPARAGLVLVLCCLAQFVVVLDIAIVNVALPSIQLDLGLKESSLQWVVIAYGLLLGGFLLLGGRLGDLLGRKRIFLTGLAIFSVASLAAGLSQTAELLIAARGLQGFGAALLAPTALSILAVTFAEGSERNKALGIYGAVGGSSASIGVIASGLLTDGPGWRWIFFINVPIGIALTIVSFRYLPKDFIPAGAKSYDVAGAATVTAGLLSLVYGLNRGAIHGWSSTGTLAFFAAAVILLVSFIWIESRASAPLVPLGALRNRTMIAANLAALLFFGGFFAFIFLGSLLMQQLLEYSPTKTGVAWLATSLTAFIAAAVVGARLAMTVGVRKLIGFGAVLFAIGVAWLTRLPADANYFTDLFPAFALAGLAVGGAAPAIQIAALSKVDREGVGLASGLVETMREIGGAIGIAAVSTVFISRTNETAADPAVRAAAAVDAFRSAFGVILVLAILGGLVALFIFPRGTTSPEAVAEPESEAPETRQLEPAYGRAQ
jgi:EmrB/QacA subfamily drug resistance transporter